MPVNITNIKITRELLERNCYMENIVTMENIVSWSALAGTSVGRGPSSTEIKYKVSWLGTLKIFLELVFVGLKLETANFIDSTLSDQDKEKIIEQKKLNKRLSSADFQSEKKKHKVTSSVKNNPSNIGEHSSITSSSFQQF